MVIQWEGQSLLILHQNIEKKIGIKKLILEDPLNSSIEYNTKGNKISIINRKIKEIKLTRENNVSNVNSS